MSYTDYSFYVDTYGGELIPESDFDSALSKAARSVNYACGYRIGDIAEQPEFTQRQIQLAVCAQADYAYQYGEISTFLSSVGGYSIGDVSVSGGAGNLSAMARHYGISDEAIGLLMPTGLLDRRLR